MMTHPIAEMEGGVALIWRCLYCHLYGVVQTNTRFLYKHILPLIMKSINAQGTAHPTEDITFLRRSKCNKSCFIMVFFSSMEITSFTYIFLSNFSWVEVTCFLNLGLIYVFSQNMFNLVLNRVASNLFLFV